MRGRRLQPRPDRPGIRRRLRARDRSRPPAPLGPAPRPRLRSPPAAVSRLPRRDAHPRLPHRPRRRAAHPPTLAHSRVSTTRRTCPRAAPDRTARGRSALAVGRPERCDRGARPLRPEPTRRRRNLERVSPRGARARPPPARLMPSRASARRPCSSATHPLAPVPSRPVGDPKEHRQDPACAARFRLTTFVPTETDPLWISFYGAGGQDTRSSHAVGSFLDRRRPHSLRCRIGFSAREWGRRL